MQREKMVLELDILKVYINLSRRCATLGNVLQFRQINPSVVLGQLPSGHIPIGGLPFQPFLAKSPIKSPFSI
jgi:hypothetical protein